MGLTQLISQADTVSRIVAIVLLAMSVASWVVILWKAWLLKRATRDVARATGAFWQAGEVAHAREHVAALDRERLVLPLIDATQAQPVGSLAAAGDRSQQMTRVLRDALHRVLDKLQFGQVMLATVGSTAPFLGLLGTVWGIYLALAGISGAGQITIDQVAGPVGEALIMTAAGLAVAIPAVLGYNIFGRLIGRIEADLEGFARDLRELMVHAPERLAATAPEAFHNGPPPADALGAAGAGAA
jgi:biopolymer transport protein ExbB